MSQNPQPPFDPSRGPQGQPHQNGPQQPYGQPGPGATAYAAAPPPKKRRVWLWVLIAILAVFLVIIVACSAVVASMSGSSGAAAPAASTSDESPGATEEDASDSAPSSNASKQPDTKTARIGDTVKAGDWQFKVTDFDCGKKSVGNEYLDKKAQGQFCLLRITAKNNGDEEGTLNGDGQKLLDDDGNTYSSDTEASLYENPDDTLFLEGVNPGNTAKGLVVFDVPKNAKITQVSLTGGFFGKSAEVALR